MIRGLASTMNDEWQLNVHKILEHASKIHGNNEVISDRRLQGGNLHKLTYKQIYERVQAIANGLESELSVNPKDVIGILDWNDHRYFESYYSVPALGSVLLTLNIRLHPTELSYLVKHANVKGLLVDETLLPLAETLSKEHDFKFFIIMSDKPIEEIKTNLTKTYGYEELIKSHSKGRKFEEIDEKSAATAASTSGTTGLPKLVYYSHRSIVLHAMTMVYASRLQPTDVNLQVVPMFHANGWGMPYASTIMGCKQIYPGRFTLEKLIDYIIEYKVTRTSAVPTVLLALLRRLETMKDKPDLKGLQLGTGGQEPPSHLVKEFEKYGIEISQGYGATETSPAVSLALEKAEIHNLPADEKFKRIKQGLIVFGVEVRVVDPITGQDLPYDGKSVGELWIRGPWVIRSYYNDPRTSQSVTQDGWWRSGDLGIVDELGYIKLVDRIKDVIKSGGEWISSVDLENFLMTHPAVAEASVIGIPHPKWGERPLAFVVLKPEYKDKDKNTLKEELKNHLLKRFSKWQLPDDIIFIEEIPKTSVGKFKKEELRKQYKDYYMKFS